MNAFKIPLANYRDYSTSSLNNSSDGRYWSSSPLLSSPYRARRLYIISSRINGDSYALRDFGTSVRCFKDSPNAPETKILTFQEHGGDLL